MTEKRRMEISDLQRIATHLREKPLLGNILMDLLYTFHKGQQSAYEQCAEIVAASPTSTQAIKTIREVQNSYHTENSWDPSCGPETN